MQYDFLNNNFTTFENVEIPKVELSMPLMDSPLDISEWAQGITSKGTPIVKDNVGVSKFKINNNEEISVQPKYDVQNYNVTERMKKATDFFQSKGLSKHAASGIVGNLMQESGNLNTTIKGDGGKAFGMAQWHPDRQRGLKVLAQSRGTDMSDFETQLEYIWQELNSTHKKALDGLLNSKTVEQATTAFMKHFEKPGILNLENRIKYAKQCYNG